jgi:hypothetical protein
MRETSPNGEKSMKFVHTMIMLLVRKVYVHELHGVLKVKIGT